MRLSTLLFSCVLHMFSPHRPRPPLVILWGHSRHVLWPPRPSTVLDAKVLRVHSWWTGVLPPSVGFSLLQFQASCFTFCSASPHSVPIASSRLAELCESPSLYLSQGLNGPQLDEVTLGLNDLVKVISVFHYWCTQMYTHTKMSRKSLFMN